MIRIMEQKKVKIVYPKLSYVLTGVFFYVHNKLGRYCKEKQYGDAIEDVLRSKNIKYEREKIIPINLNEATVGGNKVDFYIEDKILIEIKAKRFITKEDYYQTKRYLEAFRKPLALLVNFRHRYIKPKRILNINYS